MPIQIHAGQPTTAISQGRTFMVTAPSGEIISNTEQGLFAIDTRFVNSYCLYLNNQSLEPVNSSQLNFYSARFHLTNPLLDTENGIIEARSIDITINRIVSEGIHEDIDIVNYSGKDVRLQLELALRSDFADIFEVRQHHIVPRGELSTTWDMDNRQLCTRYDNSTFHRAFIYHVLRSCGHVNYANGRLIFEMDLKAGQPWHACGDLILEYGQRSNKPSARFCNYEDDHVLLPEQQDQRQIEATLLPHDNSERAVNFDQRLSQWRTHCTSIITPNDNLQHMYLQAIEDMEALRIYDMEVSDKDWVVAAGVPWFVTLFGRDSLIISLQNMIISAGFARGALKSLAEYQAKRRDDWYDAQPGKILHEIRFGELVHFHKIPFTPYYGTADATILYLIVLSEAYRWTGDLDLVRDYLPIAEQCLSWIDHHGDLDGDGFQEYKTFSAQGYENMGWKDAADAVVYADGSQVKQPKGTCELQGYVYDAKCRMAEIFQALGDEQRAAMLQHQAEALQIHFNEAFWMEDEEFYAFGLDANKHQITSIASNPGQCLWSGIVAPDKAERTVKRLLRPDMWSGWGIRTLSNNNPAYNPFSYQRGSIWPHDNGIIAAGFKRYGFSDEANYVIRGMFDAIKCFDAYRPPEVFAGLQRQETIDFPSLYPDGANIPQGWASGCIFQMLQTILGIRADAPHKRLYVHPTLPDWLPSIELRRLRVGPCFITLHFWLDGHTSHWKVCDITTDPHTPLGDQIHVVDSYGHDSYGRD